MKTRLGSLFTCLLGFLLVILSLSANPAQAEGVAAINKSDFPEELSSPVTKDILQADNRFAYKLLGQMLESNSNNENILFSPFVVSSHLQMMLNGANAQTKKTMKDVMGLSDSTDESINDTNAALSKAFLQTGLKVNLYLADSLWANRTINFKQPFLNICKQYYNAKVKVTDFSTPDALAEINGWIDNATAGKVSTVADRIGTEDVLASMTGAYISGPNRTSADRQTGSKGDFHLANGQVISVPMISKAVTCDYLKRDNFEGIILPYNEGRLRLVILLPNKGIALSDFMKTLDRNTWETWATEFFQAPIKFSLPSMDINCEADFAPYLKALGMGNAFDLQTANFSNMCFVNVPVCLGEVKHRARALVTAADITYEKDKAGLDENALSPMSFVVDRPFIMAIGDHKAGTGLFWGAVYDPR
jgi:serpin B